MKIIKMELQVLFQMMSGYFLDLEYKIIKHLDNRHLQLYQLINKRWKSLLNEEIRIRELLIIYNYLSFSCDIGTKTFHCSLVLYPDHTYILSTTRFTKYSRPNKETSKGNWALDHMNRMDVVHLLGEFLGFRNIEKRKKYNRLTFSLSMICQGSAQKNSFLGEVKNFDKTILKYCETIEKNHLGGGVFENRSI